MRYSSYLEVNLSLLEKNLNLVRNLAPSSQVMAMVKADAYGNGIIPVSKFLIETGQVSQFGCASLGEALNLSQQIIRPNIRFIVFSDTELDLPESKKIYLQGSIIPVLHRKIDLEIVLKDPDFSKIPLFLKMNTGMNRLGLSLKDLEDFLPQLKERGIDHLMTHFSGSFHHLKPNDKTHRQYQEFLNIKAFLANHVIALKDTSVSNSGAIEQQFGTKESFVRPGLMLYGPSSVEGVTLPAKGHQISRWVTKIISVFKVKKGTPIGYGVNVADKDSLMAIIPVGYGDGFLTYFSGVHLLINGIKGKVFGRINMDMTFIQFDLSQEMNIRVNDLVEIWPHDPDVIADLARQANTIPYQLMCAVSSRIPRIYKVK